MVTAWTVMLVALGYVGLLFAVASYGDKVARLRAGPVGPRPLVYALSLGVYCTSWTYFGSVGLASRSGLDFLGIYIGPILMLVLGWPLLQRIVRLSKRQNITSIADFMAARYGKNQMLGALVAVIAVIGVVPYVSLQLKAVAVALITMMPLTSESHGVFTGFRPSEDLALLVTITMAAFATLFGTRHVDATEHQEGLILAIAVESVIKLVAFVVVGLFVTYWLSGGLSHIYSEAVSRPEIAGLFTGSMGTSRFFTMTVLAFFAIILLPRQFHVAVVENTSGDDVRKASWLFPLYLVAINLFVVPIAITGLLAYPAGTVDADTFVLALPVDRGYALFAFIAYIGGISAATAMVVVETVALSIMICNNVVVPEILRRRGTAEHLYGDMGPLLLMIRRFAIVIILTMAYSYYRLVGSQAALAQTGLLSFAAVAQFAPAFFIGLYWRRGTARGAMAGIAAGTMVWFYTLVCPLLVESGWLAENLVHGGLFGLSWLRPQALLGLTMDPLAHGVLWSLTVNVVVYVATSLAGTLSPIERLQAGLFVTADGQGAVIGSRIQHDLITSGQLQATVARYLGAERAERSFAQHFNERGIRPNPHHRADESMFRFAEHILASAVGTASSRLVLGLLLERQTAGSVGTRKLLDDATAAIQYNRDLLQSAIDHVRQGIAVFDADLTLVCWNRQFQTLLGLPQSICRIGMRLDDLLRVPLAASGHSGPEVDVLVDDRIKRIVSNSAPYQERLSDGELVLEVRSSKMPGNGFAITFADITERVLAAEALQAVNESLERRVEERTAELVALNRELEVARSEAEAANLGKTRFIAAASHDILQPLNAARLFASSLVERKSNTEDDQLARNVDASLEAVEDILNALLEISRLDAGALKAEVSTVHLGDLMQALGREMSPAAHGKGLKLTVLPTSISVQTDRRLLRRVLQNLISNAIKYTRRGRVLVGVRRCGGQVVVQVYDTGSGIPPERQEAIFNEFERLDENAGDAPGLGLGLSIVRRIVGVLGHQMTLRSVPGKGSMFAVSLPIAEPSAAPAAVTRATGVSLRGMEHLSVLVIDNERKITEGMATLLKGWGCTVHVAHSGKEAVSAISGVARGTDIVLADYHLDKEDGIEVIEMLRHKASRSIPAVLITADRDDEAQQRAVLIGVGFLRKPVKPAGLRAAMNHALSHLEAAE